jgi:hypothetical protein
MLADMLPAAVSFVGATISGGSGVCVPLAGSPTVIDCNLGDLGPGQTVTVFVDGTVDPSTPDGTTLTNSAAASSATSDPDSLNNTVSENTAVVARADIWLDKTGNFPTGNPSTTIEYFLNLHNVAGCSVDDPENCGSGGPSDAQNVVVTDPLPLSPKKMIVVFVSEDCSYDSPTRPRL